MKQYIVGQVPDCCEKGNGLIQLCMNQNDISENAFTGWGIMVDHWPFGDRGASPLAEVFYCPFCGKELERIE